MRVVSIGLLFVAAFSMLVALTFQSITLASGDYRGVLLMALASMLVADVCCVIVFFKDKPLRWIAVVLSLPSLFIVSDFLRRAPYVW